jgi:hypothetical protein
MIIVCFFAWFDLLLKLLYRTCTVIVEIVGTNGNFFPKLFQTVQYIQYNFGCLGI